jgi:hypothetical protein
MISFKWVYCAFQKGLTASSGQTGLLLRRKEELKNCGTKILFRIACGASPMFLMCTFVIFGKHNSAVRKS